MSQALAVIQCRMTSLRLPAKALLRVGGLPAVTLCAKRAQNSGLPCLVATSSDPSDDPIAATLGESGLPVFRGPLEDVLERFLQATARLPKDAVVVRLTADNLFPDGTFIDELCAERARRNVPYLGTWSPVDGLPYGMSAECFTVAVLREAAREAVSPADREHVTPWIRRRHGRSLFKPAWLDRNLSHLRCTLDVLEDFLRLLRLFKGIHDPVAVPAETLCRRLAELEGEPKFRVPFQVRGESILSALSLETPEAEPLFTHARAHGVTSFLTLLSASSDPTAAEVQALKRAYAARIRYPQQAAALCVPGWASTGCDRLWRTLLELGKDGIIAGAGAAVSAPDEALRALEEEGMRHLLIPCPIDDRRWKASGFPRAALERPEVEVHAWGESRLAVQNLAIAYLRAQPWISHVFLSPRQMPDLHQALEHFRRPALSEEECERFETERQVAPARRASG